MSESLYTIVEPKGELRPIVISSPHSGTAFPAELSKLYFPNFVSHPDDTDWFVHKLYEFAPKMGITLIHANFSRYVIDLNRDPDSKRLYNDSRKETNLTPVMSFAGEPLYQGDSPDEAEIERRKQEYFWPYYHEIEELLARLRTEFEHVLFFDAHSIKHLVPSIQAQPFPDLILGDLDGQTASPKLSQVALSSLEESNLKVSHNCPFKGGHLTRYFGSLDENIHALQLEMNQTVYMDEQSGQMIPSKVEPMQDLLTQMFEQLSMALEELE